MLKSFPGIYSIHIKSSRTLYEMGVKERTSQEVTSGEGVVHPLID